MSKHINITLSQDEGAVILKALEEYKKVGMSQKEWLALSGVYGRIKKKEDKDNEYRDKNNII